MTDQPKRRGRPPNAERLVAVVSSPDAYPLPRLRWKHIEGANRFINKGLCNQMRSKGTHIFESGCVAAMREKPPSGEVESDDDLPKRPREGAPRAKSFAQTPKEEGAEAT